MGSDVYKRQGEGPVYLEVGRTCVPSGGEGPVFLVERKDLCS